MKTRLIFLWLLASALAVSVKGKPHDKHEALSKSSHIAKQKDTVPDEVNEGEVLPTFMTFESSSQEQEDEDISYEDNANVNVDHSNEGGVFEVSDSGERSTPVLLRDKALVDLLQGESEEEEVEEEEGNIESEETKSEEEEEEEEGEEEVGDLEKEEEDEEVVEVEEEVDVEAEKEAEKVKAMADEEESVEDEEKREKEDEEEHVVGDRGVEEEVQVEETDSNTEPEIPEDLDYASDSDNTEHLETELEEGKPLAEDAQFLSNKKVEAEVDRKEEQASKDDEIPTATDDYESQPDIQDAEFTESQEVLGQYKYDSQEKGTNKKDADTDTELQETKNSVDLDGTHLSVEGGEEKEEKNINKSASHTRGKARKQRKNQRVRKHPLQRDEAPPGEGVPDHQGDEGVKEHYRTTDSAVYKPKRRRAGKWAPLVGMNPVQIRATVDLYPSIRPSLAASLYRPQASAAEPCENFRCKHGKTCKLNKEKKPVCVCHEPSACPQSVTDYDHVCGSDNVTYTPCEFFATKCNLEGTKRGHILHLDYTGVCKFIGPCMTGELVQFPLRMRDWLKNVLLHLYEHDSMSPGFLTPKQRIRVRKIHESERRLHPGDHPIELLAQDFEKNYNMYIYPVHWQFAQMDQHPSDRFLSHSELAPLRVPLVPMEHCTSRFFQECDADKDKQVSFREWTHCFGIKDEDMDVNLLF
ncbi:SPARC-like protein 1 [Oncorhynchus nerka]|uniref:SPARC-like protein 1 n=1 Tax=Oncorhynchus nerka TaxID=8023 RepID=UPI0031B8A4DF